MHKVVGFLSPLIQGVVVICWQDSRRSWYSGKDVSSSLPRDEKVGENLLVVQCGVRIVRANKKGKYDQKQVTTTTTRRGKKAKTKQ